MAEKSLFWTTGATGDGASEYTQAEVIRWMRQMMIGDDTDEGVHKGYENELEVTGASSPVAVATGAALVYGFPYWNTASENVTIPTPSVATRIDRIVLRADWTAQTVRITRVAGAEGGGAPALTQSDGATWDIPLAQVSITTGGVITVTDEREFLHPNIEIEAAMIPDGEITPTQIENRTRRILLPVNGARNFTDNVDLVMEESDWGWPCPDAKQAGGKSFFTVPDDFVSGLTVSSIWLTTLGLTGNIYLRTDVNYGTVGESYNTHQATGGPGTAAIGSANLLYALQSVSLSSAAAGDIVQILIRRFADQASDTIGGTAYLVGILVQYTADS